MADLRFGIGFKTARSIADIEDWLDANCKGDWDVSLQGVDDSDMMHMKKHIEVYFELESDKTAFRQGFGKS